MPALVPLAMRTQVKRDARIEIQKTMDFADRIVASLAAASKDRP